MFCVFFISCIKEEKNISYCIPADRKLFNGECMKKRITLIVFSVLIIVALYVLYCFNYIPHKKYTNADFNIEAYKSNIDKDNDGIDDQTDILNNANNYIKTNHIDIITLTTYKRNIFSRLFNPGIARKMIFHSDTPLLVIYGRPS